MPVPRPLLLAAILAAATPAARAQSAAELRPDYQPEAFAIAGAKLVAGPDRVIEDGTVVVRKGVIEAVGEADEVEVPFDAKVLDGDGLVVYPGFIDLYSNLGVPAGVTRSQTGEGRSIPYADFALPRTPADNRNGLTPEFAVAEVLDLPASQAEERRKLGMTDLLSAPAGAIATGQSALVSLSGLPRREALVEAPIALHVNLQRPFEPAARSGPDGSPGEGRRGNGRPGYPNSLMGVVAHLRQAMLDASHDHERHAYYEENGGPRPASDPTLQALYAARTRALPVWWEADTRDEIHRALDLAEEFGTTAVIVGGREAGQVAERLRETETPVVLRLDFGDEPKVPSEAEYRKQDAAERHEPLRVIRDRKQRWEEQVATAGLLHEAGVRFAFSTDGIEKAETFHAQLRKVIQAGLPAEAAVAALTRTAAEIAGVGARLGTIEPGKLGHLVALTADYGDTSARVRYVLADGLEFDLAGDEAAKTPDARKSDEAKRPGAAAAKEPEQAEAEKTTPKGERRQAEAAVASAPPEGQEDQPPLEPLAAAASELEEDRKPTLHTGGDVLIKDATILTVTAAGTIPRGSILVRRGKIAALGADLEAPEGVAVIDATGLVAMPGIIDTHSHMAISGGVNEMSLSIVPEVRVADVVNGEDPTIYRALAGGTTTARLLHGSANTIGGQDAVVKLRYGAPGRDLLIREGRTHQGVKFALGENVTRSRGRFPNTRMGVEAVIERAFREGQAYRDAWHRYEEARARGDAGPPPRRDLRLEALARILNGSVKIHSHCYRADEILMLLRVAERHGVKVQSLQHVLEGYKVAPEIAAHGASASTFSDWWAYKIEAFDAIPFNAALLTEAGVRVCIKSDSEELVRHLYLEAAKMVKYGDVPEAKALEMITLNPARELGLEERLGSIEVGKDADIAIFNGHPFNGFARCELALIEGEVYFQRGARDESYRPEPLAGDQAHAPTAPTGARRKALDLPEGGRAFALVGATIHPVTGPDIERGTIVVRDGRIDALGGAETAVPDGIPTVDVAGLDVWPGLVDAGDIVGLFEVGSLGETQDYSDSAQFQPELRTSVALHADSELIPVTRANGILTAYVQPSGGTISGQGCLATLDGWVPSEMVLADAVALNVNIPAWTPPETSRLRARVFGEGGNRGGASDDRRRSERLDAIEEQFRRALDYDRVAREARARNRPAPAPDPRLEALAPYARGEKPVIFRAERRNEILDALDLIEELKLKGMISGGAEAWEVADRLKEADVPVLVGGTLRLPTDETDPYDAAYANPARLHEAGVRFAIRSIGQGPDQATAPRNLPYEAATAVAFGLPEDEALKAVTIYPAQLLGVGDRVGSIETGKRADLVITAGHILQPTTVVKALVVGGKPLPPESRHTRLYDKYRGRLEEVRAGRAPLGLARGPRPVTAAPAPAPLAPAPVEADRK